MWKTTGGSLKGTTSNGQQQKGRQKAAWFLTVGGFELLDVLIVFSSSSGEANSESSAQNARSSSHFTHK